MKCLTSTYIIDIMNECSHRSSLVYLDSQAYHAESCMPKGIGAFLDLGVKAAAERREDPP